MNDIDRALQTLEIGLPQPPAPGSTFDAVRATLEHWKTEVVKPAHRRLALAWHPDRNRSPEAPAKIAQVNAAQDLLMGLEVRRPEPRPAVVRVTFHGGGSTTASTTGFDGFFHGFSFNGIV